MVTEKILFLLGQGTLTNTYILYVLLVHTGSWSLNASVLTKGK